MSDRNIPTDLVMQLRQTAAAGYAGWKLSARAADEIERLRSAMTQACSDMGCFCPDGENGICPMCRLGSAVPERAP